MQSTTAELAHSTNLNFKCRTPIRHPIVWETFSPSISVLRIYIKNPGLQLHWWASMSCGWDNCADERVVRTRQLYRRNTESCGQNSELCIRLYSSANTIREVMPTHYDVRIVSLFTFHFLPVFKLWQFISEVITTIVSLTVSSVWLTDSSVWLTGSSVWLIVSSA